MKKMAWVLLFAASLLGCGNLGGGKATLSADKTEVDPGGTITVQFTAPGGFEPKAWVGIIPSEVAHGSEATNDQNDLTYQYLEKRTQGTLTFKAPDKPGSYDLRMNDSDNGGKEVASVSFLVKAPPPPPTPTGQITLQKTEFKPGEEISVRFQAGPGFPDNAWIGVIPSEVAHGSEATNDQHDLAYQYLGGKTDGTLAFKAPGKPGSYDLRMNDSDSDGKEVASVTFTVK
jgi:hypothetical protein